MERTQKNLEAYLEDKRVDFPRFYFLSNDELLSLLAQQQEISEVSRHLNKCFDNVKSLGISDSSLGQQTDILQVISNEGEILDLIRALKLRNLGVEMWLKNLEEEICKTVMRRIKDAYNYQQKEATLKKDWVLKHCCQAVSVSSMIFWTEQTEYLIMDMEENPFSLNEGLKIQQDGLKLLVDLIRQELNQMQRSTLVSLITSEVHARDILNDLADNSISQLNDFNWQKQLRYYLEDDTIMVKQVNANLAYGFEYMGATSRLVITPLTDKCWLTITGAINIKLSASPSGPAGTGKTESTKDLAKGLGYFCVVFNCSEQVEYKIMARLFSGLAQTGAWACLDEFNRIEVEVLSVIAQQLMDIRMAKLQNKTHFNFNEREKMLLKPTCSVLITMNPGYAGRTELPDNLKVLFRSISMMIPSYQLIAEVMLFAEGFIDAKRLSEKMVILYKLASEQLSQQDHYDFGMRAVKSVLVMAGNLKRQNTKESENVLLIRAMRESNIPKFLSEDLPLFEALIQDLFPGIEIANRKFSQLEIQIEKTIAQKSLTMLQPFFQKVCQLNDTLLVRFGVMIVGPSGGGKTTCYQVLENSLNELGEQENKMGIKTKVLNPKSISMGELYGQENRDTKEWTDGLASKKMRKFANTIDNRSYWIVFDGPVDALWIENLNTVLDDNMTLCLASGERIKLRKELRIIFEVQDLAVASPATVSRCGMVYMTPNDLSWKAYYNYWVNKFIIRESEQLLSKDNLNILNELFYQLLDEILERLSAMKQEQQLVCVPIQIVTNICNYLEYFITNSSCHPSTDDKEGWIKYLNAIFGYSSIWASAAHFKNTVNRHIDNIFRELFSRLLIPLVDSVFEYYLDERTYQFYHWNHQVPLFEFPTNQTPFFDLIVPTVDTIRYSSHIKILSQISKPVFITGQTGTGKSMIVQNFINANAETMEFISIILNFSAQTDSASTQNNIEGKLEKKRKKSRGAKGTFKTLIFIDDVNMPAVEQYGAQPCIELLRQLLDKSGFYDRQRYFWKEIEKFTVVCAAAPPSGGRSHLCPRFMRQFHIFNVPEPTEETLTLIFESILGGFLEVNMFSQQVKRNQPSIAVASTIDMYVQITKALLPIPAKFHYIFNLRDIAKVFQGLLSSNSITILDNDQFGMLWLHECQRVFGDRLVDEKDKEFFRQLSFDILLQKFKSTNCTKVLDLFGGDKDPIFSVIMKIEEEQPTYDMVKSRTQLVRCLNDKLVDYNFGNAAKMNLVFFSDTVNYLCAITRILYQPRGNAMLIGVSGSGKQSLTNLATSILSQTSFQLQLSKNFRPQDFRDTIRQKMLTAGCDDRKTTFILADTQIMYESFLEDINNILIRVKQRTYI